MSLTGGGSDDNNCGNTNNDSEHRAICASVAAGVTYVVAAGNNSANSANSIPAAYNEVITVSALADFNGQPGGGAAATCSSDQDDTFASFSNFGADVDIIAPGVVHLLDVIGQRVHDDLGNLDGVAARRGGRGPLPCGQPDGVPGSGTLGPSRRRQHELDEQRRPGRDQGAAPQRSDLLSNTPDLRQLNRV